MTTLYFDTSPGPTWKERVQASLKPAPGWWKETFPIVKWLPFYNRQWAYSDILCGLTVGIVVIPQSMAYAKMAQLPPQFGLYSSVMGVFTYPFIGTSKDISIGTSAINSLLVGNIIVDVISMPEFQSGAWTYASVVAILTLFTGIVNFIIGMVRLGILFDFICQPALAGFMAGSGLTIVVNQLNKILGIPNIDTTAPTYMIFGKTLVGLPHTNMNAILGFAALIYLYTVRYATARLTKRYPQYARALFFINISRSIVVVLLFTLLAFLVQHFHGSSPFSMVGTIPAGFQNMGVPHWDSGLLTAIMPKMIGVIVLQIMEHCAIATSLGKMSEYKINVNQEITSIGVANILGSFFSAYPMTGAFSRSAVTSKSGSRTPMTNIVAGVLVVITVYFLTPVLQYIPTAIIGAIVTHAVTDLIVGPRVWVKFWNTHPSELLIFGAAFILSLVTRMDIAVYVPVALSLVVQLYRVSRPKYKILGRVDASSSMPSDDQVPVTPMEEKQVALGLHHVHPLQRNVLFVPLDDAIFHGRVRRIAPGIVCFQPCIDLVFENTNYLYGKLLDAVKEDTRRGASRANGLGGRPWNDPMPDNDKGRERPVLSSIILDLTHVYVMDYTAMEALAELSRMVEQYTNKPIPWYLVVNDAKNVRHALLYAGFGRQRRKKAMTNVFNFHNDLKKKKVAQSDPETGNHAVASAPLTWLDRLSGGGRRRPAPPLRQTSSTHHYDAEKQQDVCTMTIEDISKKHKQHDTQSLSTVSSDMPPWLDCPDDGDDDDNDQEFDEKSHHHQASANAPYTRDRTEAAAVREFYPFFFTSLWDAAQAALMHLDGEIQDQCASNQLEDPLETVSVQMPAE
ncbi:sulfate transporter family-domain-containing protein [Gongronella butleri]|nr:sulfate transporter family-domain-containing protein [Gongronella butleri]